MLSNAKQLSRNPTIQNRLFSTSTHPLKRLELHYRNTTEWRLGLDRVHEQTSDACTNAMASPRIGTIRIIVSYASLATLLTWFENCCAFRFYFAYPSSFSTQP